GEHSLTAAISVISPRLAHALRQCFELDIAFVGNTAIQPGGLKLWCKQTIKSLDREVRKQNTSESIRGCLRNESRIHVVPLSAEDIIGSLESHTGSCAWPTDEKVTQRIFGHSQIDIRGRTRPDAKKLKTRY